MLSSLLIYLIPETDQGPGKAIIQEEIMERGIQEEIMEGGIQEEDMDVKKINTILQ